MNESDGDVFVVECDDDHWMSMFLCCSVEIISDVQEQLQFIEKKKYWSEVASDDDQNGQQ